MKKIVSLATALLLIFTMVFGMFAVSAANESVKVLVETVGFDKAEETATGGYYTVSVPINIIENTGFVSIKLDVAYDDDFELVGWTEGTVFPYVPNQEEGVSGTEGMPASGKYSVHNATSPKTDDLAKNPFTVYYVTTYEANNTSTGRLITLNFKVPEDTDAGMYPITATVVEAYSQSGTVSGTTETPLPDAITSACTVTAGGINLFDSSTGFNIVAKSESAMIDDGSVEVDINLENNPGITKLGFAVEFNDQYLEFDSATSYGIFAEGDFETITAEDGVLYVYADADTAVTESGKLVTLKFNFTDEVNSGEYNLDIVPNFNGDAKDGAFNGSASVTVDYLKHGTVTIKTVVLGDVNGTGGLDRGDLMLAKRYFAGIIDTIDEVAVDVNGSGGPDRGDLMMIKRYFAGIIDNLG